MALVTARRLQLRRVRASLSDRRRAARWCGLRAARCAAPVAYLARARPSKAVSNKLAWLPNPVGDSNPCFWRRARRRALS